MFAQIANRSYVDDMMIPGHSKSIVDDLVDYGKELLSMFSYEFKDTDKSHQSPRVSTNFQFVVTSGTHPVTSFR